MLRTTVFTQFLRTPLSFDTYLLLTYLFTTYLFV